MKIYKLDNKLMLSSDGKLYVKPEAEKLIIDGLEYRTVTMPDGRVWMAENLQAAEGTAAFYNNDEATYGREGKNFGRLYKWYDAMAAVGKVEGWHLPTADEWDALAEAVGGTDIAGTKLKANSGWNSGNGSDDFGFSVFPAGSLGSGSFNEVGRYANFWTATVSSSTYAYYCYFGTNASMYSSHKNKNNFAYSVRLIKDI